jgi:hypothetical protein
MRGNGTIPVGEIDHDAEARAARLIVRARRGLHERGGGSHRGAWGNGGARS